MIQPAIQGLIYQQLIVAITVDPPNPETQLGLPINLHISP